MISEAAPRPKYDKFPEYCLTFSPNWYFPQIFAFNSNNLCAFGCNDEVYLMELPSKRIVTNILMQMAEAYKIREPSRKKICAIFMNNKFLVFTNLQGYIAIVDITQEDFPQVYFGDLEIKKEIFWIREIQFGTQTPENSEKAFSFVLADMETYVIISEFNGDYLEREVMARKGKTAKIKAFEVIPFNSMTPGSSASPDTEVCVKVLDDGFINIWDSAFRKMIYIKEIRMKIMVSTLFFKNNSLLIAVMGKKTDQPQGPGHFHNNEEIGLIVIRIAVADLVSEYNKTQIKISENFSTILVDTEMSFTYPKRIANDPDVYKASPHFAFLGEDRVNSNFHSQLTVFLS